LSPVESKSLIDFGVIFATWGELALYKRHLVVTAAAFVAVGALVAPVSAYAGTSASVQQAGHAAVGNSATGSSATGNAATGKSAVTHFSSPTVGTLTADLQVSDEGTRTVQADANGSTDTGSTITGYSFSFGDGSAPLNVNASTTSVHHWYSKTGAYTVSVTVTDAAGNKATASGQYVTEGTTYTAYGPTRLLDTRNGTGAPAGAIAAGGTVKLKVAGVGTIPAGAQAAVLNLTVTAPTAGGTITAYPDGVTEPGTQNVTFVSGQTVATLALVTLGAGGVVDLTYNGTGTTQLIADVAGYFTPTAASGYTSLSPARLLDTRNGTGAPKGVVGNGQAVVLNIAGADGGALPSSGITAVALNVTVTGTVGGGYITAYPDGTTRPLASNVNFSPGDTLANLVIVPVGADGKVDLFNGSGGTQIIADVAGYFSASGASDYAPIVPQRILDTRTGGNTPIPGAQAIGLDITDTSAGDSWSLDQTGYVVTTTVTNTVAGGYLTLYPYNVARPVVSNLNFGTGQTAANLALATAGQDSAHNARAVNFYNGTGGNLDLIVDMSGYFDTF
jgi:hypothetical protein